MKPGDEALLPKRKPREEALKMAQDALKGPYTLETKIHLALSAIQALVKECEELERSKEEAR